MRHLTVGEYVEESLRLLVRLSGHSAVRDALDKISPDTEHESRVGERRPKRVSRQPFPSLVAGLQTSDPAKYRVLAPFFEAVCSGELLREPEDMRRFVQSAGVKIVPRNARRNFVPWLAQVLIPLPIARLEDLLPRAYEYSAELRSQGFSVLVAKILDGDRR